MGQARLDYMKDSAWKRGTAKKIDNLPPFELPYAKDAVLIDLVDPDVIPVCAWSLFLQRKKFRKPAT